MRSGLFWIIGAVLAGAQAGGCRPGGTAPAPLTPSVVQESSRARPFLNMPPTAVGDLPRLLSQTGAFADIATLKPSAGLISYELNVPFWSDGAEKHRWVALPPGTKITFAPTGEWRFPPGTVFVKHFELPADGGHQTPRRLETRLLVCADDGGVYGASYKWRPDQSDADLVTDPITQPIESATAESPPRNWYFPGRADCLVCHTATAGGVLGVKTRQMHRDHSYSDGTVENQLLAWSRLNLLEPRVDPAQIPQLPALARADDAARSLEDRARSFLDANCSHCHRPGGVAGNFDARYDIPLTRQNLIDGPVLIDMGLDHARVIAPRDVWRSIALARVETMEQPKMPPLAHEVIDRGGADLLRRWILSLPGQQVLAPPIIQPKGGEFKHAARVTIAQPASQSAVIRYTLDGSVPASTSPIYQRPLDLKEPATLRARAFQEGFTKSITVQETFVVED
jgi:uncharacterized repeat protein (TIGR03806 family)